MFSSFYPKNLVNSAVLAQTPTKIATLIQTIDTYRFNPPSPDPAGIVYLPSLDRLLICDSEVNEMNIFIGVNLFEITRQGVLTNTATTTSFSKEPTGVTLNPQNNHLFFSDDDGKKVYELNPGQDENYGTNDDIITWFSTSYFDSADPEGITFDSNRGNLFVVDGLGEEVYKIDPGPNKVFDGVPSVGDDIITHFDVNQYSILDPEGIAFNPKSNTIFVLSRTSIIAELTTDGILVESIDISAANARKPAGLVYAPSSFDPEQMSFYITDRGVDNNTDPNENDGKVYELSVSSSLIIGDIDGDGLVDSRDLKMILKIWGYTVGPEDIYQDSLINSLDIGIVLKNWTSK